MIPEEESELHKAFASLVENRAGIKRSYTGQNLGQQGAAKWMEDWFDITGFRTHEIDVLLVRSGHQLEAVEIKYFPPKSPDSDRPRGTYYKGIGQAIGLTRTGADFVSLHHYFHPRIRPTDINTYGKTVYDVRNWHSLPFDYRCFRLTRGKFSPSQIHPQKTDSSELRARENAIDFRGGRRNPLLDDSSKKKVERARQYLKRVLNIPDS